MDSTVLHSLNPSWWVPAGAQFDTEAEAAGHALRAGPLVGVCFIWVSQRGGPCFGIQRETKRKPAN